jgi:hypothetical protein
VNVSDVPQVEQKLRWVPGEDWCAAGRGVSQANASLRTPSQVVNGAPVERRQSLQWHFATQLGLPVTR